MDLKFIISTFVDELDTQEKRLAKDSPDVQSPTTPESRHLTHDETAYDSILQYKAAKSSECLICAAVFFPGTPVVIVSVSVSLCKAVCAAPNLIVTRVCGGRFVWFF